MVSVVRIRPWTAEQIVDLLVPNLGAEHVEVTKVSSWKRVQQRFEEQSVSQERISECRVEQVVGVPAGQMETRVSESSFGRSYFGMYTLP